MMNWQNIAFRYVMNDPRYKSGTRITGGITSDVKRFIVEMYEKATGKSFYLEDNFEELQRPAIFLPIHHNKYGSPSNASEDDKAQEFRMFIFTTCHWI